MGSREAGVSSCATVARLGREEALRLLREEELLTLGRRADAVRRRLHPEGIVTFVVDRNVNYTNVCTCQCRFCAFYRKPGDPEGYVLTHAEILAKIRELVDRGGTQVLMQGGLHPELSLEWFEELFREMKRSFPGVQNHSLSPAEIVHLARLSGLSVEGVLERLHRAGLDSIPGGGAEVLVDQVRREISPNKIGWREWVGVMEAAHRLGMPTTATLMFGSTESDEDLVEHLLRVRELQDRTGGFTAFIPWTFQPSHTELGRATAARPAGAVRYLRVLALSRLVLDNVPNVQASWVTQGEKVAQVALRFGANDLGSTMLEENVVAAAGVRFRLERERLVELIGDAGFRAAQRNTTYGVIREFPGAGGRFPQECREAEQARRTGDMEKREEGSRGPERRRETRYNRTLPLRVGEDSADGLKAESINISTRGLYCRSPRYVAPFAKLKVAVELPFATRDAATVECEGVVVRVEPQTETLGVKEYRVAVYFLNLEREAADLIARFVQESH